MPFGWSMDHVQTFYGTCPNIWVVYGPWRKSIGKSILDGPFPTHTHTHTHSPLLGTKEIRFMKHFDFLQLGKSILGGPFPTQSLPLFCRKEIPVLGGWFPRVGLEQ